MTERWFFALWPDASAVRALDALRPTLFNPKARLTHQLDLHLTLVFLGELAPDRLLCVEAAAERVSVSAFQVRLDRVDTFPHGRVLWCGPSRIPSGLLSLVRGLNDALALCGIESGKRPYCAHVTLARGVSKAPAAFPFEAVAWTARDFVLACGRAGQKPRYDIRRRWALVDHFRTD